MNVERGDVIYLKTAFEQKNHLQGGRRPYLVVSNNLGNKYSDICIVVPLTTSHKKHTLPAHAEIYGGSICLCEQIFTVSKLDVERVAWRISYYDQKNVDRCLMISLGVQQ